MLARAYPATTKRKFSNSSSAARVPGMELQSGTAIAARGPLEGIKRAAAPAALRGNPEGVRCSCRGLHVGKQRPGERAGACPIACRKRFFLTPSARTRGHAAVQVRAQPKPPWPVGRRRP